MQVKYCDLRKSSPLPGEKFDFLAGESLNFSVEKLFLSHTSLTLTQKQIDLIKKNETLFLKGTPPEYIFKKACFAGNEFYVDENVLIPRPETEMIIQEADRFLNRIKNKELRIKKLRILDVGTGSGCIIISLYKLLTTDSRPLTSCYASDISPVALRIAKKNAKAHKAKINFIKSDLLQNIDQKFDLICTNLPYIDPTDPDLKKLSDPKIALRGGKKGFELIEKFLLKLPHHLDQNGMVILEIGHNHENKIKKLARQLGFFSKVKKDPNNFPRIALLRKN